MKIQISNTKSVDVNFGALLKPRAVVLKDVVGLEIGAGDPRGCPAVRLTRAGESWRVTAVGFVPEPAAYKVGDAHPAKWTLPKAFRAPAAAIAVNDPSAYLHQSPVVPGERVPTDIRIAGGIRETSIALGRDSRIDAGLSDGVVRWVRELLPEGARPTAASVQVASLAGVAAVKASREWGERPDVHLAMILGRGQTRVVGFRKGVLSLVRTCSDSIGAEEIANAAYESLALDRETADELMDEGVVSPGAGFADMVRPFIRQLGVSRDYLTNGDASSSVAARLYGVRSGVAIWDSISSGEIGQSLSSGSAFDGLRVDSKAEASLAELGERGSDVFLGALGAAIAAMETPAEPHPIHLNLMETTERVTSSPLRFKIVMLALSACALALTLVSWGIASARLSLAKELNENARTENARIKPIYDELTRSSAALDDARGHLAELEAFVAARRPYGGFLAILAESFSSDMQLFSVRIAAPAKVTTPGKAAVAAVETETPTLRLTGCTVRAKIVNDFFADLEAADADRALVVDRESKDKAARSPVIHKFDQYLGGGYDGPGAHGRLRQGAAKRADNRRLLEFDVEYRMAERNFKR